jgi:RAB6A-GEF complex partner protein 1
MQILHERIEFCWIHLTGIGALENSLWGFDGNSLRIWLDALTIESTALSENASIGRGVRESVKISLDFYPVCGSISSQ